MRNLPFGVMLFAVLLAGCAAPVQTSTTVIQGSDYELECYLPARWEKRLDSWNKWLLPPEGHRFVWVYCWMKPLAPEPGKLYRDNIQLSYALGGTQRYTTTLAARGNNDIYMWAPEQDIVNGGRFNYGAISSGGFGDRYVFAVPENAQDLVFEISSMPPLPLTVRE
jgi:hypothetical protein